ncbi:HotDog domain-containing protein [Auriculariales sp. MPI-PUGE-AT-0066]|nr:HotDog domain-containing protein [Auriculariales sp. MPI-PUGE-AT-0066]
MTSSSTATQTSGTVLAGNATPEQKEGVIRAWEFLARDELFANKVIACTTPTRYDVRKDASGRDAAELECELVVGDDMLNAYRTLHGGCSAYIIDVLTSICLMPLTLNHVSLSMDIAYHAPAPLGAKLRIVSLTTSVGKRVYTTRCEISDKNTGRLYVSGGHIKMPPSTGKL